MRRQKYTFEQRKEWCEAYLKGEHVPTPLGARRATFVRELRDWARKYKRFGPDSVDPSAKRKDYSVAVILAAASLVASGEMSTKEAARQFNVKDKRAGLGKRRSSFWSNVSGKTAPPTTKAISPAQSRTRNGRPTSANSTSRGANATSARSKTCSRAKSFRTTFRSTRTWLKSPGCLKGRSIPTRI